MIIYDKTQNKLIETKFDIVFFDSYSELIAHTPSDKIFGIVVSSENSIYFYDGSSWISF